MNNNPVGAKCNIFPSRGQGIRRRAPNCELMRKVPGAIAILMVYKVKLICKLTARLLRKSIAVLM
jgi:hypothetical protein